MFRYDTTISDLGFFMYHVSVVLSQELHVEKLIDSVKVRLEGYVQINLAHANRRHHKVTKKMLAVKLRIYYSKLEEILEAKTHMCVRLAILTLSRRYHMDLL